MPKSDKTPVKPPDSKSSVRTKWTLKAFIDETTRLRIKEYCQIEDIKEAQFVRMAVDMALAAIVRSNTAIRYRGRQEFNPPVSFDKGAKTTPFTVRIPDALIPAIAERAAACGWAPSRWMSALVQSQITKIPVIRNAELLALLEANRELAAVGRNLNQMARHLNGMPHDSEIVKLDLLNAMNSEISSLKKTILTLVAMTNRSWGINDDE